MTEKFIAKGEEILTRVILEVDENKYVVESPYSDTDLLELTMQCIRAAIVKYKISDKTFAEEIKKFLGTKGSPLFIGAAKKIKITMEQWETRRSFEMPVSFNFVQCLLECMKSCAVLSTYVPESIDSYFDELAEELFDCDMEKDDEDEDNDNDESTISVEA